MAGRILVENDTCWRIARAGRVALLIDGENYFAAVRSAMLRATRSIYIVGWDIDSRVRLTCPDEAGDDGAPDSLGALLTHIAERRPDIRVHVLLWDYSMLYALEREPLPSLNLDWRTPPQIDVCLDDVLPLGASHHQKIVVVDDSVAFCGGLDLAIRRWDSRAHDADNPHRVDPDGESYPPFHDMQMMVDGDAAAALAELVRDRWGAAACETPRPVDPAGDRWPESVEPDFTDVDIGLARTLPAYYDRAETREVERLYIRAIEHAERFIYIENQYLTAEPVVAALAARLKEKSGLKAVLIGPKEPHGWAEAKTMTAGRARFMRRLDEAGVADRVRLHYPVVRGGDREVDVMVHAKLMIVDDAFLRVGSSNLNHRSMGFDTECDVAIEAANGTERERIAAIRNGLLAEHLGVVESRVAEAFESGDIAVDDLLSLSGDGRALKPVEGDDAYEDEISRTLDPLADPDQPIDSEAVVGDMFAGEPAGRGIGRIAKLALAGAILTGLAVAWTYSPLAGLTDPGKARPWFEAAAGSDWAYLLLPAIYVIGGLVVFPITVLIALTAMVFGPWSGFALAAGGSLLSATVTYQVGAVAGRRSLRDLMGRRLNRISRAMGNQGILSVVAMRVVPVAPFTFINLVAGASHIGFRDYILGTVLGMLPGIAVMTALGDRLRGVWDNPATGNVALLALAVAAWILLSLAFQFVVGRLRRRGG